MIKRYSSKNNWDRLKANYDKEMRVERGIKLKRKFEGLSPEEFVKYSLTHPECPKAHEYITRFGSPEFLERVLELIDRERN